MKKLILIFVIMIITNTVMAQTDNDSITAAKNTVFVELFGIGGLYSINFDRIIYHKKKSNISLRGGLSYAPFSFEFFNIEIFFDPKFLKKFDYEINYSKGTLFIPVEINYMIGKKHFFEVSVGLLYATGKDLSSYGTRLFIFGRILGYRFQKPDGGFFAKMGVGPMLKIIDYKSEFLFNPNKFTFSLIGLSFGYTIKKKKP